MKITAKSAAAAAVLAAALLLSGCAGETGSGGSTLSGKIVTDGSSTVGPLTRGVAIEFLGVEPDVEVTVAIAGTGGGFRSFCAGETDISNASREISDSEIARCEDAGIEFTEVVVANDGLSVVVNPEADWIDCITVEQLRLIWAPESQDAVLNWNQVDASFPDVPLTLYGPGTDSGTFDYFTDVINGEEGASRTDYSPSEDDNKTIEGVSGEVGAMGYLGFTYLEENSSLLKGLEVDGGDGCVFPSVETVQDGSYTPLSRPLFIYVNNASYADKAEVQAFVDFYVEKVVPIAEAKLFVPLTDEQITIAQEELDSLGG